MKLYVITFVTLLSFWGYADNASKSEFFLKAEGSGEKYGPFECKEGEKIIIGKQAFVINKLDVMVKNGDLQAKLERLVIPELAFDQADIAEVVKFLDQVCMKLDKESSAGNKGVNFILRLKNPNEAQTKMPKVTLMLKNISVIDAVKYITEVAGLQYKIEENAVVIEEKAK